MFLILTSESFVVKGHKTFFKEHHTLVCMTVDSHNEELNNKLLLSKVVWVVPNFRFSLYYLVFVTMT